MNICRTCNLSKDISEFVKSDINWCKLCKNESRRKHKQLLLQKRLNNDPNIKIECSNCEILKDNNNFEVGHNQCNECRNKKSKEYANKTPQNFLRQLFNGSKSHAKHRSEKGRIQAGEFSITFKDIENILEKQDGKCYYSNIKLFFKKYSDWQCSIERIDPKKGYIIENIALICSEFQSQSQWDLNKYSEFIRLINIKHSKQIINWDILKEKQNRFKIIHKTENGIEKCKCNKCGEIKLIQEFITQRSKGCTLCRRKHKIKYKETANGHIQRILDDIIGSSKRRNFDPTIINTKDLQILFDKQNGLCEYSGIPMTFGSYLNKWWTASIERKDVTKGYIKDNICFICLEFNTPDQTNRIINKEEITGNSGWSINKIEYIKNNLIVI